MLLFLTIGTLNSRDRD